MVSLILNHTSQTVRKLTFTFRKMRGHSLDELPYKAKFGVAGSYVCAIMNLVCLIAQFYVALWPVGGPNFNPTTFFQDYLAGPFLIVLYLGYKIYTFIGKPSQRPLYVALKDIDLYTGMREGQRTMISGEDVDPEQRRASIADLQEEKKKGPMDYVLGPLKAVF